MRGNGEARKLSRSACKNNPIRPIVLNAEGNGAGFKPRSNRKSLAFRELTGHMNGLRGGQPGGSGFWERREEQRGRRVAVLRSHTCQGHPH